jgi:hypothetical protein
LIPIMTYFRKKIFFYLYNRMTKFSGAFPKSLGGRKIFFNACSGLPTHKHKYLKISKFNSPYCGVRAGMARLDMKFLDTKFP